MELSENQRRAVFTTHPDVVVVASAGSGKALKNGSLVLTNEGYVEIEKLKIGDDIFGEDGKLHQVLGVFPQGKKEIYAITFSDNSVVECCEDHIWCYQTARERTTKKPFRNDTLKNIIKNEKLYQTNEGYKRWNIYIPMTEPINFTKKNLKIKPYLMGALLGDGSLICSKLQFSNIEEDVVERVKLELEDCSAVLNKKNNCDYFIGVGHGHGYNNTSGLLTVFLKNYNLLDCKSETKFIPSEYKFSNIDDRLELLKGLIDTDGTCAGSYYEYTTVSETLCDDVKFVAESLGFTAVKRTKEPVYVYKGITKKGKIAYTLRIKTNNKIPKIHYSQKREKQWRKGQTISRRTIRQIVKTNEYSEMTCIMTSNPSGLFLTNNCIVTHNTRVLTERVNYLLNCGIDPSKIVAITFTNLAAYELINRIKVKGDDGPFIGTMHSYANKYLKSKKVDTSEYLAREKFDELIKKASDIALRYGSNIEYLLVDEFQDLCGYEYEFLINLGAKNNFFIGDDNQAIYGFKGGRVDLFVALCEEPEFEIHFLPQNYRSTKDIIDFGEQMLPRDILKKTVVVREGRVPVKRMFWKEALREINKQKDYSKWFVLTRSNRELEVVMEELNRLKIPNSSFKTGNITPEEVKEKMSKNDVKVLTIHTAKGMEKEKAIVIGAKFFNDEEKRIAYVGATRAKNVLYWCDPIRFNYSNNYKKPFRRKVKKDTGFGEW